MGGTGVIDNFLGVFTQYIDSGFGLVQGDVRWLAGVLIGAALSHAYATADVFVAPSRSESYGMAVTEALAHGVPVIAAAVGGLPEALGSGTDGSRPGRR